GVDGAARELPGDAEDDAGHHDGGDGVGEFECGNVQVLAGVGSGEAEQDGGGRPDVGAEVDSVGFEGFAFSGGRDAMEFAGAGEVDGDGEEQDDERPDGGFEDEVFAEGDAVDGFGKNPDAGGEHEDGFDRGG